MRVLVTGGTGFIGRNLVEQLLSRGHLVTTLSRAPQGAAGTRHFSLDAALEEAIPVAADADAVVHLAALSNASASFSDPYTFARLNSLGTLSMLEGARKGGGRVIFASSQRIYRPSAHPISEDGTIEPQDPYGYSKLCGEEWMEMYRQFQGVHTTTLRFFSVYGPGLVIQGGTSGVVGIFAGRALRGEKLLAHTGQLRDLTYVSDVVQGIVLSLEKPSGSGSCYNIATGTGTSMEALAEAVREAAGSTSEVAVEPGPGYGYLVADISRARADLGYEPQVSLAEGLRRYIAWYRARG